MSDSDAWAASDKVRGDEIELIDEIVVVFDGGEVDERQLAAVLRDELDGVERALERLDAGTYGLCETCGAAIDDDVLAVAPQSRSCSAHLV